MTKINNVNSWNLVNQNDQYYFDKWIQSTINLKKTPQCGDVIQIKLDTGELVRIIVSKVNLDHQSIEGERIIDFLEPVRCANVLEYKCGCKYEFQLIGAYAPVPTPHLIPCFAHTRERELIEKLAELDWENITSSVRS